MATVEKYTTPILDEYRRIWSQVIRETIHPAIGTRNFVEFEWCMKFNEEKTQISLGFLMILQDVVEAKNKYNQTLLVLDRGCDRQEVCLEFPYNDKKFPYKRNFTTVQDLIRYSVKVIKYALSNPQINLKTLAPRLSTYDFDKVINDSYRLNDLRNGDLVLNAEGDIGVVVRDDKTFDITFTNAYLRDLRYNEYLECPSAPEYNIVKVLHHNYYCASLEATRETLKTKSQKDCGNEVMPYDKNCFYITEEALKRKLGLGKYATIVITKD